MSSQTYRSEGGLALLPEACPTGLAGCTKARLADDIPEGCPAHARPMREMGVPFGVVGVSHHTAPLEIRARLAIAGETLCRFGRLAQEAGIQEWVVLSTCNRTEIYYAGGDARAIEGILTQISGLPMDELRPYLYEKGCLCAACHLFRVASGMDSAVLGETEIVAQIREAWKASEDAGVSGPVMRLLFPRAFEASKRVRTETDLCRSVTSTASLAVRTAETFLEGLRGRRAVLIGAGKIAERVAKELHGADLAELRILNRTRERAEALASRWGGIASGLEELEAAVAGADVVVATVAVESPILTRTLLDRATAGRKVPLLVVDMGVPPNVELGSDSVEVIDIDRLTAETSANAAMRFGAIPAAQAILNEELHRFGEALAERAAAPTIRALVRQGEEIRKRNLEWARERLPNVSEKEMRVVEEMARRMMLGFLQAPIEGLKGELSAAEHRHVVERLFALEGP